MNIRQTIDRLGFADENTVKGQVTRAKKIMLGLGASAKLTAEQKENDEFTDEQVKDFLISIATGKSVATEKAKEVLAELDPELDIEELRKAKNRQEKAEKTKQVREALDERDDLAIRVKFLENKNAKLEAELKELKTFKRSTTAKASHKARQEAKALEEPTIVETSQE